MYHFAPLSFVPQDDVVMGTLTVRENLMFSAELRLPKHMSRAEKAERVEQTIYELGLQKVANSKVGNMFIRGISGGIAGLCGDVRWRCVFKHSYFFLARHFR